MSIFTFPRGQAFDTNGLLVSGAKLYFYEAGTSTEKNTYSDSALTSANTNPVVANSAGLFGPIYLAVGSYKVTLTDSSDVELWSQDNVNLSVAVDSYTPSHASAQSRTIQSKLDETVSITDFGAAADGSTYTTEIQAAISSLATDGTLWVPPGTFVTGALTLQSNMRLLGPGTLKLADSTNDSLLNIPAGSSDIEINGVTLDGNYANNASSTDAHALIDINSTQASPVTDVTIAHCRINNAYQNGIQVQEYASRINILYNILNYTDQRTPIELSRGNGNVSNVKCVGNTILNGQKGCITATSSLLNSLIADNYCGENDLGSGSTLADNITAYASGTTGVVIRDNQCIDSANHGIHIAGGDSEVRGNYISGCTQKGVFVSDSSATPPTALSRVMIANNKIVNPTTFGIHVQNHTHAEIYNNKVYSPASIGIAVEQDTTANAGDYAKINDNLVVEPTASGIRLVGDVSYCTVSGNTVEGGTAEGIRLFTSGNEYNTVTGNTVTGCTVGIQESNGTNNIIVGNSLNGNSTAPIQSAGTGTIVRDNWDGAVVRTLADDATPSVLGGDLWETGGTTTITDFDDGFIGQTITIKADHAVTITDNANIVLSGGANFVMASSDTLTLTMFDSGVWQEISRSVN